MINANGWVWFISVSTKYVSYMYKYRIAGNFRGSYFRGGRSIREKRKSFAPYENFPLYSTSGYMHVMMRGGANGFDVDTGSTQGMYMYMYSPCAFRLKNACDFDVL